MAAKDYEKHYAAIGDPGATVQTPNNVSRCIKVEERALQTTVWQSGKAVLDAELQLYQDAAAWDQAQVRRWQAPSGWLRGQTHHDGYCDYTLVTAPVGIDNSLPGGGDATIHPDGTLINALVLPRIEALVAGQPVVVEYTCTATEGYNLVGLEAPPLDPGPPGTIKRTDFVFLECWPALVAPSPRAQGLVQIVNAAAITPMVDTLFISGAPITAWPPGPPPPPPVGPPPWFFQMVPGDETATALNLATTINTCPILAAMVEAKANGPFVTILAQAPGLVGNFIGFSVFVVTPGCITVSGVGFLAGGDDRPNKPIDQSKLFRHGNVQSPTATWLDDEIVDPTIDRETTQRVQFQYRIRVTGSLEAVNWITHPDGFSSPGVLAQGALPGSIPGYPFVPADGTTVSGSSSAVAYGHVDPGLWIAGDGTDQAAKDLGTLDGFVYAIPICFVYRLNNATGVAGFNPVANANGGPTYDHAGYAGALGAIPAGASDRPDFQFCNVITTEQLLDLRQHVILSGAATTGELQYQIQSLLDGKTRSWAIDTAMKQSLGGASGDVSTHPLICNEIGRANANGGDGVISGTTARGTFAREFDHVARRFGQQGVTERVVFAFYPGDRQAGPPVAPGVTNPGKYVVKAGPPPFNTWFAGDVLHLDLDQLDATVLGGIFQGLTGGFTGAGGSYAPGGPIAPVTKFCPKYTKITDVLGAWHDDGRYKPPGPVDQSVQIQLIQGLGTTHVEITLDLNTTTADDGLFAGASHIMVDDLATNGSQRRIFVEFEVTYPIGSASPHLGVTDTPQHLLTPDPAVYTGAVAFTPGSPGPGPGPQIENDTGQQPNDRQAGLSPLFREGKREIQLEYVANETDGFAPGDRSPNPVIDTLVSQDATSLYFPRRAYGGAPVAVTDLVTLLPMPVDATASEFGSSSRLVKLVGPGLPTAQTQCQVLYYPQDPIPNYGASAAGGYQVSTYYRTNAPQTAGVKDGELTTIPGGGTLPYEFYVEPLVLDTGLWSGQTGVGSLELPFPYSTPLDQIPEGDLMAPREWYYCANANISVADFDASTGLLNLHTFVQQDGQDTLLIGGQGAAFKPRKDPEFRAYYRTVNVFVSGMTYLMGYQPAVFSQPLTGPVRHKVMFPFLARVAAEMPGADGGLLFRKDELVLIVLSRWTSLEEENDIRFGFPPPTWAETSAAVYKTRNRLLVVGSRLANCSLP